MLTSEAVKTEFGSNSEFFFHKKFVFAQKNDFCTWYILESAVITCWPSLFCGVSS